jgi:hypothetical protein
MRVNRIALFIFVLMSVFMLKCKKAHSEEARVTSCPTSIKDGKSALVFTRTSFGWQAWCGFNQQIFCNGTFTWLDMDEPAPIDGHKNNGKEQWAFYPEKTTTVKFGYTCTPKNSK